MSLLFEHTKSKVTSEPVYGNVGRAAIWNVKIKKKVSKTSLPTTSTLN